MQCARVQIPYKEHSDHTKLFPFAFFLQRLDLFPRRFVLGNSKET